MNGLGMKDALENIARAGVLDKINLWPKIEAGCMKGNHS